MGSHGRVHRAHCKHNELGYDPTPDFVNKWIGNCINEFCEFCMNISKSHVGVVDSADSETPTPAEEPISLDDSHRYHSRIIAEALAQYDRLYDTNLVDNSSETSTTSTSAVIDIDSVPLPPQSGYEASIMKANTTKAQNVKFSDQHENYTTIVDSVVDDTRKSQDTGDASLENFFSRPLKIFETEWAVGGFLTGSFNPWSEYFENPRVANRIANFNLLRAKLHLKVVVNGNGFLYGRAFMGYQPHSFADTMSTFTSFLTEDLTQLTQLPKVTINPTTSTGGELVLPFFHFHNYLDIPISEWQNMGTMHLLPATPLKHANDAAGIATISVFAWAEDVELSVLTSVESSTLTPQSGAETDEANKEGFISGPATKVAHAAGTLAAAPIIGPYASATSEVASGVANLAKVFGYCRPTRTADPTPYKPAMVSPLALTTVPDAANKLTVDDKQELSIDPRIAGLGANDPLDIRSIASRESYLTQFTWAIGAAPETLLWNARVDPVTWVEGTSSPTPFRFPACAMAALPFEYWTGTMNFRFQIVSSSFHKGRLKFVYDPNFIASNEYNINYMEIVDIADKTDFTISVSNGQNRTYLSHHLPGSDSVTQMYSTTPYASVEEGNGVLGVYVVNELTSPNNVVNNDIQILVHVSMGDDFEVAQPDDYFQRFVFKPQSGTESTVPESENTSELDAPEQNMSTSIGPRIDTLENINSVFFGETVRSFRPLLKRYTLHECIGPLEATYRVMNSRRSMFPYLRGNVTNAVHLRNTNIPYNYCNTLLLHWVTYAFAGWRGSMRYKVIPRGPLDDNYVAEVERYNITPGENQYLDESLSIDFYTTVSDAARAAVLGNKNNAPFTRQSLTGYNGLTRVHRSVNPNVEFEIPYYGVHRYSPGKKQDLTGPETAAAPLQGFIMRHMINGATSTLMEIHAAVGEDYQAFFWTGLPSMYYEPTPPTL